MPRGSFELPTNPEGFRDCSTAVNDRLRVADSSSVSAPAQFVVHLRVLASPFSPRSQASFPDAWLLLYDREDAARTARLNRRTIQRNSDRLSRLECKPKPFIKLPGGRFELPTKGL